MNGESTKYYKYESATSGNVTIPNSVAKVLNWSHKDEIKMIVEVINGKKGLFLYKDE